MNIMKQIMLITDGSRRKADEGISVLLHIICSEKNTRKRVDTSVNNTLMVVRTSFPSSEFATDAAIRVKRAGRQLTGTNTKNSSALTGSFKCFFVLTVVCSIIFSPFFLLLN